MKIGLDNLLKQAQAMQSKMQSAQTELAQIVITGVAGADLVKIEMDGKHNLKSVWLNPILFSKHFDLALPSEHPDPILSSENPELILSNDHKKFIEELIAAAFHDAWKEIEKKSREKLDNLMSQIQTNVSSDIATTTE